MLVAPSETSAPAPEATRLVRPSPLLRIAPVVTGPAATTTIDGALPAAAYDNEVSSWPSVALPVVVTEITPVASMEE